MGKKLKHFKDGQLIYPDPVKDGLQLWYDFAGKRNTDTHGRDVAEDLSGNGNDGILRNFSYSDGSGYDKNHLLFDGIDDYIDMPALNLSETFTSVGLDGKFYAYEDDKVVTVGEKGEILTGGRNFFPTEALRDKSNWNLQTYSTTKRVFQLQPNTEYTFYAEKLKEYQDGEWGVLAIADGTTGAHIFSSSNYQQIKTIFNHRDANPERAPLETTFITPDSGKIYFSFYDNHRGSSPSGQWVTSKLVNPQIIKTGSLTEWNPAPEEYQVSRLTTDFLRSLQLYDRPLQKAELIHSAESISPTKLIENTPVQDGLVLHYDFSQENNNSLYRGKAFDYSGNGNHGELQNFAYTAESGYVGDGLKFDGVDDEVNIQSFPTTNDFTLLLTLKSSQQEDVQFFAEFNRSAFYLRKMSGDRLHGSIMSSDEGQRGIYFISPLLSQDEIPISVGLMVDNSNNIFHLILNGEIVGSLESYNIQDSRLTTLGKWSSSDSRFIGDMFSTHFYNRPLTPEEIAHNYAIEKERFGIE